MLTEEQLKIRRQGIGGSEIADIMGKGFGSPYQVWLRKLDLVEGGIDNEYVEWGQRHETTIAQKVQEEHKDKKFVFPNSTVFHPEIEWALGTVDGLIDDDGVWECKTAGAYSQSLWGEPGTDDIPEAYILQCQWYMFVLGRDYTLVSVLIGGNTYREYTIERNDKLIEQMVEAGRKFWHNNVLAKVEPIATDKDGAAIKEQYPDDNDELIEPTDDLNSHALRWRELNNEIRVLEKERERIKNNVMMLLKDAAGVIGIWGKIKWTKGKSQRILRAYFNKEE